MSTFYKKGDWNAICALCGGKFKASDLKWNNQINDYVCKWDWESRHPQERLRATKDDQTVAFTRPDPPAIYTNEPYVEVDQTDPVYPFYAEFGYSSP